MLRGLPAGTANLSLVLAVFVLSCAGSPNDPAAVLLPPADAASSASRLEDPDKELSPAALKEDFERLRFSLEEAHAGFYRYVPESEMDKHFEALERRLSSPLRVSQFYSGVLKLAAAIRDGHTSVQAPDSLVARFRQKPIRPPISLHLEGRRRANVEQPDIFGGLFALEYGETEKYIFRLRSADGKERDHEVAGLSVEDLEKRMGPLRPPVTAPLLSLRFEGDVAILT